MNPELARHWIELIRGQLPADANVELHPNTRRAGFLFIDRPAPKDGRPHRRSQNATLYFPQHIVARYLKESADARTAADRSLARFVRRHIAPMNWNYSVGRHEPVPGLIFTIDSNVLFP